MEFLKELFNGGALTYDQLASAVKGKGYSVVNAAGGAYVPKSDIDGLNGQITTLQTQLGEANKKLEGYDPNWKQQAEADRKKLEAMQFDFALEKGVSAANPRNAKAVMALIDRDKLKFAGGELIGLEKQLDELKKDENTAFLFSPAEKLKTGMSHQNNGDGAPDKKDAANEALRSIFRGGN